MGKGTKRKSCSEFVFQWASMLAEHTPGRAARQAPSLETPSASQHRAAVGSVWALFPSLSAFLATLCPEAIASLLSTLWAVKGFIGIFYFQIGEKPEIDPCPPMLTKSLAFENKVDFL